MTTQELATASGNAWSVTDKIQYAKALAQSGLLPDAYRKQPENVLVAVELGEALRIPPIQAINGINVIKGKPTMSADLMAAVIRRAGHTLRITEHTNPLSVEAELIRADDPEFAFRVTWTEAKARTAGLWGKGNWATYPGQMLRNRAISEVARQGASDALMGVIYVPEELASVDAPPVREADVHPGTAVGDGIQDAEVVTDEPEPISDHTRRHVFALLNERGITDADQQRAGMSKVLGRDIASRTELTEADGQQLIASLEQVPVPQPETDEPVDAEVIPDGE